jgi:hypothetical protein
LTTIINASTVSGLVNSADTSGILQLQTASTAALTIDASQNTTLAGTLTTTGITNSGVATATRFNPTGSSVTGNGMYLPAANSLGLSTNGTNAVYIDSSQKVGIGTVSPTTKLQVSAATPVVTVTGTGTTASSQDFTTNSAAFRTTIGVEQSAGGGLFSGSTSYAAVFGSAGASNAEFATNNIVRMKIDTSGIMYVGTQVTISGNQGGNFWISNTTSSSAYNQFQFKINGTDVGQIQTSGSSTAYQTSSDYRLKENIQPMQGALAKVAQLKPVTYKWKLDGSDGQGFIAHELQEIIPDCVGGTKDEVDADGNPKYQGIDTSFLVATLTAALQETKALIDTQAETINALTARIVALESKA